MTLKVIYFSKPDKCHSFSLDLVVSLLRQITMLLVFAFVMCLLCSIRLHIYLLFDLLHTRPAINLALLVASWLIHSETMPGG